MLLKEYNKPHSEASDPCVTMARALRDQVEDLARLPNDDAEALGLIFAAELGLELGVPVQIRLAKGKRVSARAVSS